LAPLERMSELDTLMEVKQVDVINSRTKLGYMGLELKREASGVTRTARFDLSLVCHSRKFADGSYVSGYCSINDTAGVMPRSKKYVRMEMLKGGWVVQPLSASSHHGHPRCRVMFLMDLQFPGRVSGWVLGGMVQKAAAVVTRLQDLMEARRAQDMAINQPQRSNTIGDFWSSGSSVPYSSSSNPSVPGSSSSSSSSNRSRSSFIQAITKSQDDKPHHHHHAHEQQRSQKAKMGSMIGGW